MATDITKPNPTAARPSTLSLAARERIALTFSRLIETGARREIIEAHAPSENERHAMRVRVSDLADAMRPAAERAIEAAVGRLLAGFPAGKAHKDEPERVIAMFIQALRDLPDWAISSACSAWNRGEYPGKRPGYSPAPSPSDLRDLALAATEEFDRERRQINAILAAEVVPEPESDEKRAEVAARVKQWVKDRTPSPGSDWTPRAAEDISADLKGMELASATKYASGLIPEMQERRAQDDMDERQGDQS